jgi:cyclopropane-fatty-acyl-phospholipid synthase
MLNLINASPGDHILEIGCGWGGVLEYAGKRGYMVTGVTISDEQYKYVLNRIKEQNLDHLCKVELCDYRLLNGRFDAAVSIEMVEAVGEKYWDSYFSIFKKLIRPGGRYAIQSIVMNDKNFESYRKGTDFIQQYIFPGGMLLSPMTIINLANKYGHSEDTMINFGIDYAKTLGLWSLQFNLKLDEVKKLGFDDRFIRLWNFYLGYCQGAFKSKRIDVVQFSAKL